MGTYTVSQAQPLPIFPDGAQSQLTIYNRGPATLYAGESGSVSRANGYEIPALASIGWRANRPLHLVTDSILPCVATVDTAAMVGDVSRASVYQQLIPPISSLTNIGYNPSDADGVFETSSYNSLNVTLNMGGAKTFVGTFNIDFFWYDADKKFIHKDTTVLWIYGSAPLPARVVTLVKGYYCKITINQTGAIVNTPVTMTTNIYGTTRLLDEGWYIDSGYIRTSTTSSTGDVTGANSSVGDRVFIYNAWVPNFGKPLLLPGAMGQFLTVTFQYSGTGGPTGSTKVQLVDNTGGALPAPYSEIYLPASNATSFTIKEQPVPTNRPIAILHDSVTNAVTITAVFSN